MLSIFRNTVLLLIWLIFPLIVSAQADEKRPPITLTNVAQLEPLATLGRGWLKSVLWSPDGTRFVATSSTGLWLYDTGDFAADPIFITAPGASHVVFNAGGRQLAFAAADNQVHVWDLERNQEIKWITGFRPVFDPQNMLLTLKNDGDHVVLWNSDTEQELFRLAIASQNLLVAVSPDNRFIALAVSQESAAQSPITIWDTQTGRQQWTSGNSSMLVDALVFSPNGCMLAASYTEADTSRVSLWNVVTGSEIAAFEGSHPVFSPDSVSLALAVGVEAESQLEPFASNLATPSAIQIRDLSTGTLRATLERELLRVSELSFTFGLSPSLLTVAAETHYWLAHQDIFVWDFSTQAPAILLEGHDDSVVALVFSPDHTLLASQSVDQTVRIWDVRTHQTRAILNYNEGSSPYSIDALEFSPDGHELGVVRMKGVYVWDLDTGREILRRYFMGVNPFSIVYTNAGWIVLLSGDFVRGLPDKSYFYNLNTGAMISFNTCMLNGAILSPDHQLAAAGGRNCDVGVWQWQTQTPVFRLPLDHSQCGEGGVGSCYSLAIAFDSTGKRLVTAWRSYNFSWIGLWDVESGARLTTIENTIEATFSPDGSLLVTGGGRAGIQIWSAATGDDLALVSDAAEFDGVDPLTRKIWSIRLIFSPDGHLLAARDIQGFVHLWEVNSRVEKVMLDTPANEYSLIIFSPDSQLVVTITTEDFGVELSDAQSGKTLARLDLAGNEAVRAAFSPDGRLLAVALDNGTVQVWGIP